MPTQTGGLVRLITFPKRKIGGGFVLRTYQGPGRTGLSCDDWWLGYVPYVHPPSLSDWLGFDRVSERGIRVQFEDLFMTSLMQRLQTYGVRVHT